jgi:hypothetical protein
MPTGSDVTSAGAPPAERLIQCARTGNVSRRLQAEVRRLAVAVPLVAGFALVAAVVAPSFGGSQSFGVALLGAGVLVALALLILARRPRDPGDDAVRHLDRDAGLDGDLRSAYWFATHLAAGASPDTWITHHLEVAATRASAVSWASVYPTPRARRSWVIAAALAVATFVMPRWSAFVPRPSRPASAGPSNAAAGASAAVELPPTVTVPQLLEAFRAMKTGGVPTRQSLAAVERAMQDAEGSLAQQAQLANLFDRAGADDGGDDDSEDLSWLSPERREQMLRNREDERASQATMARLQWAVREAGARVAAANPPKTDASAKDQNTDSATGAEQQDSARPQSTATGATEDRSGARQTVEQRASDLDTGRGMGYQSHSSEHDPAVQAAAKAATAHLAEALRREVVQASADQAGASVRAGGSRRATNAGTSPESDRATGALRTDAATSAVVRSRTPEARQRLVRDYFSRTFTASAGVP